MKNLGRKRKLGLTGLQEISHDIRTPLSMIIDYAGELEESSSLSNREQEHKCLLCNQGIKIRELVNDPKFSV